MRSGLRCVVALHRFLLQLVHPTQIGEALVPGATLLRVSTELGLRLTFEVAGRNIHVEVFPKEPHQRHAAASEQLLFAYRSHGLAGAKFESVGKQLCEAVAQRARVHEASALKSMEERAQQAREEAGQTRIREVRVEQLLEHVGHGDVSRNGGYYTLSPYVGCLVGCKFCYAGERTGMLRALQGLQPAPWGSYVDVRTNAAEVLRKELGELPPLPIKFCPIVSDPYQAAETRYRVTRGCLEVLADVAPERALLLLSRTTRLREDIELMTRLPALRVGASIPTVDDAAREHFEPRGAPIEARFAQLEELRARGITTFAVVQPMLPGNVEELADRLLAACDSVSIDVLDGVYGAAEEFSDPRYAFAAEQEWQVAQARALAAALGERGVPLWRGDLPPDL
ncbi:MAG: DNA repair photolyase [Polyangiales bacterium]